VCSVCCSLHILIRFSVLIYFRKNIIKNIIDVSEKWHCEITVVNYLVRMRSQQANDLLILLSTIFLTIVIESKYSHLYYLYCSSHVYALWLYCSQNLKKKLIWLSNLLILSVPGEGYSRNVSCAHNLIYTFSLYIFFNHDDHILKNRNVCIHRTNS
jgi:hypothetical protein